MVMDESTLREAARILASRAGKAAAGKGLLNRSPEDLRAHQQAAARKRWARMSKRQRRAQIRKMLAGRRKREA